MTPAALAALHAHCFTDAPAPWSASGFESILAAPATHLYTRPNGFLVARHMGPEAEVLTLAVDPSARRQGTARALMAQFEAGARIAGVQEAFLDVSEANTPARALYTACGFGEVARRPAYYSDGSAALVMRKDIRI